MKTYHGLRIAFLCGAESYRGSAVSFQHLAEGLAVRSAVVRIFTTHPSVTQPLRDAGLDVVELPLTGTNWSSMRRLRAELKAFGAEVLVVDRPRDLRLGWLATLGTRIALVSRYNSHRPSPPRDFLTRLAYRLGVRHTIFLTHEMAQRVTRLAPWMRGARHEVIPEGICTTSFAPSVDAAARFRAEHGLADAPFVLCVGALTREKRTAMIIDAMALIPDAPLLVICGEGPLAEKLERNAALLGIRTKFLGRLPREQMVGAYSAATVVAHACDVETFGLSVLEAMACGAAVVGVRSGGLREVVGEDGVAGLLVPADDMVGLGEAMHRVLNDPALRAQLGAAARERAESQFALDKMMIAYELAALSAFSLVLYELA